MRTRSGLSVVEVLVALMLVAIGLLGMAGSTALALRTTLDATRRREAAQRAALRIAILSAAGCDGAHAGASDDAVRGVSEAWSVAPRVGSFAAVTERVTWRSAGGTRAVALHGVIPC